MSHDKYKQASTGVFMLNCAQDHTSTRYLSPDSLHHQLETFTKGMAVTKGSFELLVERCTVEDVEWNHMDQMHRPTIHNTYESGIRIACGKKFAVSLTKWSKWPFLITVSDVYVAKGLFYQSLTIAGIIFIHSIISLEQVGNDVKLKDQWFIASHKLFKFLHGFLNKKLYNLNKRLQQEDEPVRQGRLILRKKDYRFKTDNPDYYNSNMLGQHTIYPKISDDAYLSLEGVGEQPSVKSAANIEFLVKKTNDDTYLIWPAVCPHEGGSLTQGQLCDKKISCPWHGLQFSAVELSPGTPVGMRYGFEYNLMEDKIFIKQPMVSDLKLKTLAESDSNKETINDISLNK